MNLCIVIRKLTQALHWLYIHKNNTHVEKENEVVISLLLVSNAEELNQ